MSTLTADYLISLKACSKHVAIFQGLYPDGLDLETCDIPYPTLTLKGTIPMPKSPTLAQVCAIVGHPRAETSWIARPVLRSDGTPGIERVARIVFVYPRDGVGCLRVAVTDWTTGAAVHHVGTASGCGYDKRAAALAGATIGGHTVHDHCGGPIPATVRDIAHREGWEIFGDVG